MDEALEELNNIIAELEYKNQFYLEDIEKLGNANRDLQDEITDLNDTVSSLLDENDELEVESQHARRSFTGFQVAVSMLVFVYGMLYGSYLCPK